MTDLTFEDFKKNIEENIRDYLPEKFEDASITFDSVVKNNDTALDGITIREPSSRVAPTIYVNGLYEDYRKGRSIEDIMQSIADIRLANDKTVGMDKVEEISDISLEKVRDKIKCKLINAENNINYLEDKPHIKIDDLAVTFYIDLGSDSHGGKMSVAINNSIGERLGIDAESMKNIAVENAERNGETKVMDLEDVIASMLMPDKNDPEYGEIQETVGLSPTKVLVLTNNEALYGASSILNYRVMDDISDQLGDFYILPSSVHEVLIVRDSAGMDGSVLADMVRSVNISTVDREDRLSDNVYRYDRDTHEIYRADKAEEHEAAKDHSAEKNLKAEKSERKKVNIKEKIAEKKADIIMNDTMDNSVKQKKVEFSL